MPVEKTTRQGFEVVDGACFGYYDETFDECLACRAGTSCKKATVSPEVDEVRKSVKNDPAQIDRLEEQYK